MKKIAILLGLLFFCCESVFAADTGAVIPEQSVENNQSYFTANIQKQPQEKGCKQGIKNHFTFFTININVNGKVLNYTLPDKEGGAE
jgi:hypothetical protein